MAIPWQTCSSGPTRWRMCAFPLRREQLRKKVCRSTGNPVSRGRPTPRPVAARHERDRQRLAAALAARERQLASADVSYKQNLAKAETRSPAELAELLNTPYQRLSAPDQLAVTVATTKARQAGMSVQEYVQKLAAETTQPVVGPAGQAATAPMVQTSSGLIVPASAINPALVQTPATPAAEPVADAQPSIMPGADTEPQVAIDATPAERVDTGTAAWKGTGKRIPQSRSRP